MSEASVNDAVRVLQARVKALEEVIGEIERASKAYLTNAGYFGDEPEDMVETAMESYMLTVWQAAEYADNGEDD